MMSTEPAAEDVVASRWCQPDFFYDLSVENCVPCDNICGQNGFNRKECKEKCPSYADHLVSSTTAVATAMFPTSATSSGIWVILATSSILLAATTLVIMLVCLRNRKRMTSRRTDQSDHVLLPQNIKDSISPGSTETVTHYALSDIPQPDICLAHVRSIYLHSKHYSSPNFLSNHSCLRETASRIPHSNTEVFDERNDQRDFSPISLKSDLSLAGHDIGAGVCEIRSFSGSSLTSVYSSINSLFHMFGWLNKTQWVMEYSEDSNGLRIGIEGITKASAEDKIRRKGQHLRDFHFVVTTTPTKGRYVPCPHSNTPLADRGQISSKALKSGTVIFSDAMERDPDSSKSEAGYATYSGALGGLQGGADVGLTVGHLFEDENQKFFVEKRLEVGWCMKKYTTVTHRSLGQVTADLALLHITVPTDDTVTVNGQRYRLRIFKADLCPKSPVIVLHRNGSSREGIIADSMCTLKKDDLYNTLRIVQAEGKSQKITEEGYSGALVLSRPAPEFGDRLFVYGMVIGYWESDNKEKSHTVATRLWNIVETVTGGGHGVDFSWTNELPLDSGYQSFVAID